MIDINPSLPEQHQATDKPLNLNDFAQRNHMTEDRVWELIEEGELAARFINDEILILREHESAEVLREPEVEAERMPVIETGLKDEEYLTIQASSAEPKITKRDPKPEDDFSEFDEGLEFESKREMHSDDHRDLLLFAQDAMTRTMELSRQLLATKDELIRFKDEKLLQQQSEIQKQELELRRLKRKIEDLETLCRLNPMP